MISVLIAAAVAGGVGEPVTTSEVTALVATPGGCNPAGACYPAGREVRTQDFTIAVDLTTYEHLHVGDTITTNGKDLTIHER